MNNTKTTYLVKLAMLIAVILLLEITSLGNLKVGVIEITLFILPVAIGAIALGPAAGAALGLTFGLVSFWECFGKSLFGASLLAINPLYTLILCLVPRVLAGCLAGLIFKALKRTNKMVRYVVPALSAALINTLIFVPMLMLMFGSTEFIVGLMTPGQNVLLFMLALVGLNGVLEIGVCSTIGAAVARALDRRRA